MTLTHKKRISRQASPKIISLLKNTIIILLTLASSITLIKAQTEINQTTTDDSLYKIENIENLKINMQLKEIKEKIYKEFSTLASAYADFHEAILDFFNKIKEF